MQSVRKDRQKYIDSNFEAARSQGCDCLQLKYDGWWTRFEITKGKAQAFSRTGRRLPEHDFVCGLGDAVLVGELMFGTNWSQDPQLQGRIFFFDCWFLDDADLSGFAYRDRYSLLKTAFPYLPKQASRVLNFPIESYETIWNEFVVKSTYEGVIFRRSKDDINQPVYRQKNVVTDEYKVTAITEGEGKHSGRLGALVCTTKQGVRALVGGGFTDDDREEIFSNPQRYVGRYCFVEGRSRFPDTGLLRHPNFCGWKPAGDNVPQSP
jgi:hypothetical protein